jgi:ankyrin repeat protein
MCSFFSRLIHYRILRIGVLMLLTLVALVWSGPAFCGEIHDAANRGDLEKVQALLRSDPNLVLSKDDEGFTPLHQAVNRGHKDVAELLLAHGADVNARLRVKGQEVPLHLAVAGGHKDVVGLLLAHGADVNAKNNKGGTPLHLAAYLGHKDIVGLLLAHEADVNARTNIGDTPLHSAASGQGEDVVELLLVNKAEVNAKDNKDETPLVLAAHENHEDFVELLRRHGGHE